VRLLAARGPWLAAMNSTSSSHAPRNPAGIEQRGREGPRPPYLWGAAARGPMGQPCDGVRARVLRPSACCAPVLLHALRTTHVVRSVSAGVGRMCRGLLFNGGARAVVWSQSAVLSASSVPSHSAHGGR